MIRKKAAKESGKEHPRVFISYSHDSAEHAEKVLAFADKLRAELEIAFPDDPDVVEFVVGAARSKGKGKGKPRK